MILQRLHALSLRPAWQRFVRAARDPAPAQLERLMQTLAGCRGSAYARHVGLERAHGVESFQATVPIVGYDDLRPFIERAAAGEAGALTHEPIRFFEQTSGSTSTNKLIPFTSSALAQISEATSPWLYNLYAAYPALLDTRSYWSISPAARAAKATSGGIPIGAPCDREYFGALGRWALGRLMAVDESVGTISDVEAWAEETCRQLVAARDLGLISVWSPTFLNLLLERIGRPAREVWPRLALISCWVDGDSARFIDALRAAAPDTPIQPKGLLATEGVVSIPVHGQSGAVAAVTGHFLEFIDLSRPDDRPRLVQDLEPGGSYSPVLTTRSGLLRYHLPDIVECVGRWHALPRLVFQGRLDRTSDLVGEKLNPARAERALGAVDLVYEFALLAPASDHYVLYIEAHAGDDALEQAARIVDERLADAVQYAYCRRLGQLGPVRVVRVMSGHGTYRQALLDRGCRLGDIKPAFLDARLDWREVFS